MVEQPKIRFKGSDGKMHLLTDPRVPDREVCEWLKGKLEKKGGVKFLLQLVMILLNRDHMWVNKWFYRMAKSTKASVPSQWGEGDHPWRHIGFGKSE
jgi:hypothetical protein